MKELEIKDLHVEADSIEILHGINLSLEPQDKLALLGPNGHGKSTLLNTLMGNPHYKITSGKIIYKGQDITNLKVEEKAKLGFFMAFQNPPEISGVESIDFYKQIINCHREKPINLFEFYNALNSAYKKVDLPDDMNTRFLNEGFSGGEKKRNEILQMILLNPPFVMLDEIDSGLDVDALKLIGENIVEQEKKGSTFIIISHYARLFSYVHPNKAAIIITGKIALTGDTSLITKVDTEGYEFLSKEYGIKIKKEETKKPVVLETCAYKKVG